MTTFLVDVLNVSQWYQFSPAEQKNHILTFVWHVSRRIGVLVIRMAMHHITLVLKYCLIWSQPTAIWQFSPLLYKHFCYTSCFKFMDTDPSINILTLKGPSSSHIMSMWLFCQYTTHTVQYSVLWYNSVLVSKEEDKNKNCSHRLGIGWAVARQASEFWNSDNWYVDFIM